MRSGITLLVVLALATCAVATEPYGWTISASDTDPYENTTPATFGVQTFYLWLACCDVPDYPSGAPRTQGYQAVKFGIIADGIVLLAISPPCLMPEPPPLPDVFIACPGCPCGPVIQALILVLNMPGSLCFGPASDGEFGTVDCETEPTVWGMDWIGIDTSGASAPCSEGALCGPVPVTDTTWGRVKGIYR